jgi:hypothetical protein
MARFLTPEWFAELEAAYAAEQGPSGLAGPGRGQGPGPGSTGRTATPTIEDPGSPLVVEISVAGVPQGEVRYQVVVEGERARVVPPGGRFRQARAQLSSDYATMAGIASGELSATEALSLGRARISGDTGALSSGRSPLAGLDLLPAAVRARTTF